MKRLVVYTRKQSKRFAKLQLGSKEAFILAKIPYDIHCGKHSGFPDCCIRFFITKWIWIWDDQNSKFMKSYRKRLRSINAGYVPCSDCLKKKKFITVKNCPKSCLLKRFVWGKDWWKKK